MHLRPLQPCDAPLMLQWMHDPDVVQNMGTNFAEKTLADCEGFISACENDPGNLHFAIADSQDTYMGTVSLKHIDRQAQDAEFAITVCKAAMGKGYSRFAMEQILHHGLTQLCLKRIYWCVSPKNVRAVRFYDKCGYPRVSAQGLNAQRTYTQAQIDAYIWYAVENGV